ncbi:hypothetical protein SFRURICE_017914, partial [Spodoptera frugiperda]
STSDSRNIPSRDSYQSKFSSFIITSKPENEASFIFYMYIILEPARESVATGSCPIRRTNETDEMKVDAKSCSGLKRDVDDDDDEEETRTPLKNSRDDVL